MSTIVTQSTENFRQNVKKGLQFLRITGDKFEGGVRDAIKSAIQKTNIAETVLQLYYPNAVYTPNQDNNKKINKELEKAIFENLNKKIRTLQEIVVPRIEKYTKTDRTNARILFVVVLVVLVSLLFSYLVRAVWLVELILNLLIYSFLLACLITVVHILTDKNEDELVLSVLCYHYYSISVVIVASVMFVHWLAQHVYRMFFS